MKNPKVSVLMTVYNTDKYLKSSINSILNQSFKKWELIVADDYSTDKSKEILRKVKDQKVRKFFLNN
jgi:glycosyltransferase involved in cell wall biosynthesis|tara:strand:+ start:515 stop:715 length:201 start_codon:yes stop_codon:yes gene_type:complete